MFRPRRILLPTDLSELALSAFPWAVTLAERFKAQIDVLFADPFGDPIDLAGGGYSVTDPERIESMKELARRSVSTQVADQLPDGIEHTVTIDVDAPYRSIVRHAENADLVVMGTHGRSGWKRALLGSVTETVLRETETPLLTIRAKEGEHREARFSRIVCPVNYTEMANTALMHAVVLAEVFDTEILVVHVIEDVDSGDKATASERLEAWIPPSIASRMKHQRLVLKGDPAEEVVDLARRENADLVIVGAQHRTFSDTTVIGVTTERVTRHAPCPVLTVHG